MVRTVYTPGNIINVPAEGEMLLGQGAVVFEMSEKTRIVEQTRYRWRDQCSGRRIEQARRAEEREKWNRWPVFSWSSPWQL